jgi:DNA-binding beta-propeller fold protein YncE
MRTRISVGIATALMLVLSLVGSIPVSAHGSSGIAPNGLFFVDYRSLNGGADGVALINLDPESADFGQIMQEFELGEGVLPHHLYYNYDQSRLYNTTLGGEFLYELLLERDEDGVPTITGSQAIDTGESIVGEDMFFTGDGETYWMTFIGGSGGERDGSIGVFDAQTNALINTIVAPEPENPANGEPFVLYPHGISANEDLGYLMVTSTVHPDLTTGVGNTVTVIDMETGEPVQTALVGESWEDLTQPVEVLMLRDGLPSYALVTTIFGGDIWIAPFDEQSGRLGEFTEAMDGGANGLGVALEFYIGPGEDLESDEDQLLYVSFAVPGVVNAYSLDNLPELELVKTFQAEPGAHHFGFFVTESGREAMVIQNNLLNGEGINAGTFTIVDIHTGESLGSLDLAAEYGLMPESVESAMGNGHFIHH